MSNQGGRKVADLNSESDLDMTGVRPVLLITRKAPAAEAGAGTGGVAEDNPPATSTPSRRPEIGSVDDSSDSSSSRDSSNSKDDSISKRGSVNNASQTSNGSSSTSGNVSSEDIPTLIETEARRLQHFGKTPDSRADARGPNHGAGL